VEVVIAARNEEERIGMTVRSLFDQSLVPSRVVVVDDGSTDATGRIARDLGCEVVTLPYHESSYLGRPELASTFNAGLRMVSGDADYVMILGADHSLPEDYILRLVEAMEEEGVVAGSGGISNEREDSEVPRNSGMLVRTDVWMKLNGMQYPTTWGYEGWLLFRLREEGHRVKLFPSIKSSVGRATRIKGTWDGRAMYVLGYDWKYVMGRVVLNMAHPADSLKMLSGFLGCCFDPSWRQRRSDVADWVNKEQKASFWNRVRKVLTGAKR
jgi:glycosyltransferase involved in cell wall biosynthesis